MSSVLILKLSIYLRCPVLFICPFCPLESVMSIISVLHLTCIGHFFSYYLLGPLPLHCLSSMSCPSAFIFSQIYIQLIIIQLSFYLLLTLLYLTSSCSCSALRPDHLCSVKSYHLLSIITIL